METQCSILMETNSVTFNTNHLTRFYLYTKHLPQWREGQCLVFINILNLHTDIQSFKKSQHIGYGHIHLDGGLFRSCQFCDIYCEWKNVKGKY